MFVCTYSYVIIEHVKFWTSSLIIRKCINILLNHRTTFIMFCRWSHFSILIFDLLRIYVIYLWVLSSPSLCTSVNFYQRSISNMVSEKYLKTAFGQRLKLKIHQSGLWNRARMFSNGTWTLWRLETYLPIWMYLCTFNIIHTSVNYRLLSTKY